MTQLLSQRTHYYDAGLKGSTALIYYDHSQSCFLLQRNDGQFPLDEPRLLAFLAEDIRKNVTPADGEHGPTKLLAMRLKPVDQQQPQQQQQQQAAQQQWQQ